MSKPRLLVIGASARAMAESAARAGYPVSAIDAFGDLDLAAFADCRRIGVVRGFASRAVRQAQRTGWDEACYASSLENHPQLVRALAKQGRLLGNSADVLAAVRNPLRLAEVLSAAGLPAPRARTTPPRDDPTARWLLKPRSSGGGHGIRRWRRGVPITRNHYLQEEVAGLPGSLLFVADGRNAVPLGLTRQLIGDPRFGAAGFRYCGNLLAAAGVPLFPRQAELMERAEEVASVLTTAFGLVGANGVDFIARGGVPYPVEVNPRYTAAMELLERRDGISIFELHRNACLGRLPRQQRHRGRTVVGKAVVFARRTTIIGETGRWLADPDRRDIPWPSEQMKSGQPICTVFSRGRSAATSLTALYRAANEVYLELDLMTERAA